MEMKWEHMADDEVKRLREALEKEKQRLAKLKEKSSGGGYLDFDGNLECIDPEKD